MPIRYRAMDLDRQDEVSGPTTIYNDNQACVSWSASLTTKRVLNISQFESWSPIPIPWRTEHRCGITIKGKWEQDALRPGIRLFLESHPQKVSC